MTATRPTETGTDLRASATGRAFRIPGSEADVGLRPLRGGGERPGHGLLVDFPPDWVRSEPGHYRAAEEFVVLAGELVIDGVTHAAGDWAWLAAGHRRSHTTVGPEGARVVAWFSGDPRWVAGGYHVPHSPPRRRHLADAPVVDLDPPLDVVGERLRADADTATWLVACVPPGLVAPTDLDLVDLDGAHWRRVAAGTAVPATDGTTLLRLETR